MRHPLPLLLLLSVVTQAAGCKERGDRRPGVARWAPGEATAGARVVGPDPTPGRAAATEGARPPAPDRGPADPGARQVSVRVRWPVVGQTWRIKQRFRRTMAVVTGVVDSKTTDEERLEATEQVTALRGRVITAERVAVHSHQKVTREGVKARTAPTLISKRSFTLTAGRDGVSVTSPEGPLSAAMVTMVKREFSTVGERDYLLEAMPTVPMVVGQRIPALERGYREELLAQVKPGPEKTREVGELVLTLEAVEPSAAGEVAVFLARGSVATQKVGEHKHVISLRVQTRIRARDGQLLEQRVQGRLLVVGVGPIGELDVVTTYTPLGKRSIKSNLFK